ncbi:MAG: AAA family ATPase [Solirubrobacteraceae bacterium]
MGELLERDDDLGALSAAVDEAAGGRGSMVLVGGEAGIGKTSLLRGLRERIDASVTFLVGACEPLSVPVPLGPWREIVEAATGRDLADAGTDDRIVLAREAAKALEQRAPAVAAIEDVHWADPLTLDLLRLLARRVEQMDAVIVVTFREGEVASNPALGSLLGDLAGASAVRRIAPRALSAGAVHELAVSSGLDPVELARLTGGNPFLVMEAVSAGDHLPVSVRDAVLARAASEGGGPRRGPRPDRRPDQTVVEAGGVPVTCIGGSVSGSAGRYRTDPEA